MNTDQVNSKYIVQQSTKKAWDMDLKDILDQAKQSIDINKNE